MFPLPAGMRLLRLFNLIAAITLVIFRPAVVNAQLQDNYRPLPVFDTIPPDLERMLKNRLSEDQQRVGESGRVGSYIRTMQEKRTEAIIRTVNADLLILDGDLQNYLQEILEKIYAANPQLPRETRVFPYRSEIPNALSFGEGTLSLMLGLLARLESEDQIAFVLCHELAHYHTRHADTRMRDLARLNYDKDLKRRINSITSSQYDRYTRLRQLYKELSLEVSQHSRSHEAEADSIGLSYYLKTTYSRRAPLRCMQILDRADSSAFNGVINLKALFDFPSYRFKDNWSQYQKSTTWHASVEMNDTTRTHPDCQSRFRSLQRQLGIFDSDSALLNAGSTPNHWQAASFFELVNSLHHLEQYGKSLFLSLNLVQQYPHNTWLHAMIGRNLYRLWEAQKEHRLAAALELPDPRFDENYDRFLTFIHKLRLTEIANLAYHYVTTRPEKDFLDEEFLYTVWLCSTLDMSQIDPEEVRKDYKSRFPSGRHLDEMKKRKSKY